MAATSKFVLRTQYVLLCLLILNFSSLATPSVKFSYPDSASNSNSEWENINTDGGAHTKDGILVLTDETATDSCSWATYHLAVPLMDDATKKHASFTTSFSFIINATNSTTTGSGDGIAFFLSPFPHIQPDQSCGGNLGLFTSKSNMDSSQNNVVAVEFDTYYNEWDPRYYHVGIDVNSIYSVVIHKYDDIIKNGTLAHAWVNYSAEAETLNVFLVYGGTYSQPPNPGDPILSYPINLASILPSKVAVGFSASTGKSFELHQVLSWEFTSTFPIVKEKSAPVVIIAVLVATGLTIVLGGIGWFLIWRAKSLKRRSNGDATPRDSELPRKYSYKELAIATSNFAPANKLGEGGFGPVFKGYLRDTNQEVAVKQLKPGSDQGMKEFHAEVEILRKLRHANLVELFGWCGENGQHQLVYKYMPNGSLRSLLDDPDRLLLWPKRYKIILNLADALCYLQPEAVSENNVVHRDIKPDNVLLDSSLNAKLSDFGLARLVENNKSLKATAPAGSRGYMAPELSSGTKPSNKSDIYSFGVVLLEIACGRKPAKNNLDLVGFVWECFGRNKILEAADKRLRGDDIEREMERVMMVGLWCGHPAPSERPTIQMAKKALNFEDCELPALPRSKPSFAVSASGQMALGLINEDNNAIVELVEM